MADIWACPDCGEPLTDEGDEFCCRCCLGVFSPAEVTAWGDDGDDGDDWDD